MSQVVTRSKRGKTILFGYDRALGFFFDKYNDPFELTPSLELSTLRDNLTKVQLSKLIEKWLPSSEKIRLQSDIAQILAEGEFVDYFIPKIVAQYKKFQLEQPRTRIEVARLSPSFGVLEKLIAGGLRLDSLQWREFEELIAELLEKDGYSVELGSGRDDGGKDLVAIKDLGEGGSFKAVWQAKLVKSGKKVGVDIIRELADTRSEHKASKGVLVTSTYLTQGALGRVQRDKYILGKVDKDDLMQWIERVLQARRK